MQLEPEAEEKQKEEGKHHLEIKSFAQHGMLMNLPLHYNEPPARL